MPGKAGGAETDPGGARQSWDLNRELIGLGLQPRAITVRRHACLFRDGDPGSGLLSLIDGVVRAERLRENGRRQILGFYEPGDIVGLPCTEIERFTCVAMTAARLHAYTTADIERAAALRPQLVPRLLSAAARGVGDALDLLALHGNGTAMERLCRYLLQQFNSRGTRTGPVESLQLRLSRTDIADLLGVASETICRGFTTLRNDGLIRLPSPRIIELADRARFEEVVNGKPARAAEN